MRGMAFDLDQYVIGHIAIRPKAGCATVNREIAWELGKIPAHMTMSESIRQLYR